MPLVNRIDDCPALHATCDYEFDREEMIFLAAIQEFKRAHNIKFPTWTQVLRVVKKLGYVVEAVPDAGPLQEFDPFEAEFQDEGMCA